MWIKYTSNTSHIPSSELARPLFPLKCTNNIRIKITHYRIIREGGFGKYYHS